MKRAALSLTIGLSLAGALAFAQPPPAAPPAPAPALSASTDPSHGDAMRAYHAALARRKIGQADLRLEDVRARVAESEDLMNAGRTDEAIARLTEIVEHPNFSLFADTSDGHAAVFRLGDALATAGIYEPARAYLRRVLKQKNAWGNEAAYSRRAVRRMVDVALESQNFQGGAFDLQDVPASAPDDVTGEVHYMRGRAREAAGDPEGAYAEYAQVKSQSRFWAQATYLMGLIQVEKGKLKEGEDLFCKVADPKRSSKTAPFFADARYFQVRDLARLALGRIAHEQGRNDDARYYYYLVPKDSDRLAEALYEAATTRYEKKDYDGARELLDELKGLGVHHPYEDEAWLLDAYIDLARCKFEDADKKLNAFITRFEPVRDAAKKVEADEGAMGRVITAARTGADAAGGEPTAIGAEPLRAIAAIVRVDPAYGAVAKRRAVLEHQASGLRHSVGTLDDMRKNLATNGGTVRATDTDPDPTIAKREEARAALDGLRLQIESLVANNAPADKVAPLKAELATLEARYAQSAPAAAAAPEGNVAGAPDLPDMLAADAQTVAALQARVDAARAELAATELSLAKDAIHRVDLRLSRLLRRARLGRIESVLGRKRALEVEIEAIGNGILPQGAVDSLDAARFLQDNEEYWPFEGDDWPDEFVGTETGK